MAKIPVKDEAEDTPKVEEASSVSQAPNEKAGDDANKAGDETKKVDEALPKEGEHKPSAMSQEVADALKEMEEKLQNLKVKKLLYIGPSLHFKCRADKEHSLVKGKEYDFEKLPKHELIVNAWLRGNLVKAQEKQEA